MRTAHVRANGKKIAVTFVSPPKKTNKETQTRLIKLVRNETFIVNIPPDLELEAVEEEEGFIKIDISEIPDGDDNLHSYLDVDLEFLEDTGDGMMTAKTPIPEDLVAPRTPIPDDVNASRTPNGNDLVAARTPTPFPLLLLPPTDQTLSLSSAEGAISCCDDESVEEVRLEHDVVVDEDTKSELSIRSDISPEETKNDQDDQSQVENLKVDRTDSSTDNIKTTEADDTRLCDFVDTTDLSDLISEVSDGDPDGSDSGFPCDSSR